MADESAMEQRLERVEAGQVAMREEMQAAFALVPTREEVQAAFALVPTREEMLKMIRAEGVETRRHFDMVAEKFKADVALLGEAHETLREQVDRIERQLRAKRS
jgi:hypothetical protein